MNSAGMPVMDGTCVYMDQEFIKKKKVFHKSEGLFLFVKVRLAAHVSNGLKSRIRPVVGRI